MAGEAEECTHPPRLRPRRAAFHGDVHITTTEELRGIDYRAVIAWERTMRETEQAAPSTVRRRLSALSSLFKHLVQHGHAAKNPVAEIARPAINRDEGSTLAFAKAEARKMLDLPNGATLEGLRNRAILSVGLRRAEIAVRRRPTRRKLSASVVLPFTMLCSAT